MFATKISEQLRPSNHVHNATKILLDCWRNCTFQHSHVYQDMRVISFFVLRTLFFQWIEKWLKMFDFLVFGGDIWLDCVLDVLIATTVWIALVL